MYRTRSIPIVTAAFSLFLMACLCNPTGIDIPFVRSPIDIPEGAFDGAGRSGKDLFATLLLDPMPATVTVLHSEDETPLLSPTIYLHFTLDPADVDQILANDDWQVPQLSPDFEGEPHVDAWWLPEALPAVEAYEVFDMEGCKCFKKLFVNGDHTEAYFLIGFF